MLKNAHAANTPLSGASRSVLFNNASGLIAMTKKIQIINTPDKFFIEKVQKGLDDSANSKVNTKEQAKKKLAKWLK